MFKDSNTLLTTYMYSLRVQTKSSLRQCTRKPIPPPLLPRVVSDPSGNSAACKVDREKYLSILENLWASFLKSVLSRSFHIHHFHTAHHTPCKLPKILQKHCFQFLLGITVVTTKTEGNNWAKFLGGKQYIMVIMKMVNENRYLFVFKQNSVVTLIKRVSYFYFP